MLHAFGKTEGISFPLTRLSAAGKNNQFPAFFLWVNVPCTIGPGTTFRIQLIAPYLSLIDDLTDGNLIHRKQDFM